MIVQNKLISVEGRTAVALGFFDGVHLGHAAVISGAVKQKENGLVPTVFTFTASPQQALGGPPALRLMSRGSKERVLADIGVEQLVQIDFKAVMDMTPQAFVEEILVNKLHAEQVFCGFNYRFGRGGKAGGEELECLCAPYGVQVHQIPPVLLDGSPVSSTRIRSHVEKGDMSGAMRLLGRPFSFDFAVAHGRQLGRTLGTPTLNQVFERDFILPRFGVYASVVRFDGTVTYGVTNVGVKPTVGSRCPLAETWMPEYCGAELYGRQVETALLAFIRPEKKFGSLQELQSAIFDNAKTAKQIYEQFDSVNIALK